MKEDYILFVDTLGRLLIGKNVDTTQPGETTVGITRIKNPAIIHATHKQDGGLQIAVIPLVFREFLADRDESIVFQFNNTSISVVETPVLDARIIGQYEQMFAQLKDVVNVPAMPTRTPTPTQTPPQNVIKLFDN